MKFHNIMKTKKNQKTREGFYILEAYGFSMTVHSSDAIFSHYIFYLE